VARRAGHAVPVHGQAQAAPVRVEGKLAKGVYAKDVILAIINILGVKGGVGYAYEYAGDTIDGMSMKSASPSATCPSREARASATSIRREDGGVSPRPPYVPAGAAFDRAATWWKSVRRSRALPSTT